MHKSKLLYQLSLPKDTVTIICSFLFYTVEQSIQHHKKHYQDVLDDIRRTKITYTFSQGYMNRLQCKINIIHMNNAHPIWLCIRICNECRQYIKKQIERTRLFVCQCH
jgi:hypothetical protein